MRRARRWVLWGMGIAAVAVALSFVLRSPSPRELYDRIQVDMMLAEVEEVLGGPEGKYGNDIGFMLVGPGHLAHPRGKRLRVWYFNEGLIEVLFDANDRVLAKIWSDNKIRRSIWQRFRDWLGIGVHAATMTAPVRPRPTATGP